MPRPIRAFTLSEEVSYSIDQMTKGDPRADLRLRILLHPPDVVSTQPVDKQHLSTEDYAALYDMLPLPKHARRTADLDTLHRNVYSYCDHGDAAKAAKAMLSELRKRQLANRKLMRRLSRKVSASGVADALLSLGLEALAGKVALGDTARSSQSNAREAGNKRSHSRRR